MKPRVADNIPLAQGLECPPMSQETWVQSQVESYQRLKKWYLMPPYLTLSIIRYGSRVKQSNPGKEQRPPQHIGVVAIEKGAFGLPSTMVTIYICIYSSKFLLKTMELCLLFLILFFLVSLLIPCDGILVVKELSHIFCPSTFKHTFCRHQGQCILS